MRVVWLREKFGDIEYCLKEISRVKEIAERQNEVQKLANHGLHRLADLRDELINELTVRENNSDPLRMRMTNAQRDRLWEMCGRYGVEFNERDYFIISTGWVEGWVGGINHSAGTGSAQTIYVGVSPEGDSHT